MSEINIIINGEERKIPQNLSISELIDLFELDIEKIAIEKNLEIIDSSEFKNIKINEGDKIEIVHFIGGG